MYFKNHILLKFVNDIYFKHTTQASVLFPCRQKGYALVLIIYIPVAELDYILS